MKTHTRKRNILACYKVRSLWVVPEGGGISGKEGINPKKEKPKNGSETEKRVSKYIS